MAKRASRCSTLISFSRAPGSSTVTTISLPSSNTSTSGSCTSSTTTRRSEGPPLDDATAMPVRRFEQGWSQGRDARADLHQLGRGCPRAPLPDDDLALDFEPGEAGGHMLAFARLCGVGERL